MAKEKTSGVYFKVTDEKRALIEQRMALAGIPRLNIDALKGGLHQADRPFSPKFQSM